MISVEISPEVKAKYAKDGNCPVCGSEHVYGHNIEIVDDVAFQKMECESCHATWDDLYKFFDIENVETADEKDIERGCVEKAE